MANLDLVPNLGLDTDLAVNLSASAQSAFALHEQICIGLPQLPPPPGLPVPQISISIELLAALTAMAQLNAQAGGALGIDLSTSFGITAIARLAATLDARLAAIAGLNLNLEPWIQIARVNSVALSLTAIFEACLHGSASTAFNVVAVPPAWGGPSVPLLSALVSIAAQMNVDLDPGFLASLQTTAAAIADVSVDISIEDAAGLVAGASAIAQLGASLGVNPLQAGFASVRAMVASNFSAMASNAARLGIDLALGAPPPASIPGFAIALSLSLAAQAHTAAIAAGQLDVPSTFTIDLSVTVLLAASLSVSLGAALDVAVALPAPCFQCDLPAIMAALPPIPAVPAPSPPGPPDLPGSPGTPEAPGAPASPAPAGTPVVPAPATAGGNGAGGVSGAGTASGAGGSGAGSSGGGGAGGVPETVMTAQLACTMGLAPSALTVLPVNRTMIGKQVAANIMDHAPMVNILPFGMCTSPANPTVAAATAAALGVLTPMPCIPATASPWAPGSPTVLLGKMPMLNSTSKCMCTWAGVVSIVSPGQVQTMIP